MLIRDICQVSASATVKTQNAVLKSYILKDYASKDLVIAKLVSSEAMADKPVC